MPQTLLSKLKSFLNERFGGVLKQGSHEGDGECCVFELYAAYRNRPRTDDPDKLRTWDLRCLNDIWVSDEVRTKHLLPVLAAYAGSMDWPPERRRAVAEKLAILTVRRIVSQLSGLSAEVKDQCEKAESPAAAAAAAVAAAAAAAVAAAGAGARAEEARAARAATVAAATAARAEAATAARAAMAAAGAVGAWAAWAEAAAKIFVLACEVWLEAAA